MSRIQIELSDGLIFGLNGCKVRGIMFNLYPDNTEDADPYQNIHR